MSDSDREKDSEEVAIASTMLAAWRQLNDDKWRSDEEY